MKRILYIVATLFLLLGSQPAFAYDGKGTAEDPYLIKTAADWKEVYKGSIDYDFAGKYIKLVADISVIDDYYNDNVIGWSATHPFRGIFDGDGHTLTFKSMAGEQGADRALEYMAPFRYVGDGAVIKNLHVVGIAQTYKRYLAGLVARASKKVVIRNCWVSISVNTTGPRNYKDAYNGGIVAEALGPDSDLTLENCRFDGKMLEKDWVDYSGGLVGKADGKVTLKNCIFKPSLVDVTPDHCATLVRMGSPESLTLDKCYYFTPMGTPQGTNASSMSASDLAASLGGQWEVVGGEVVPILLEVTKYNGDGSVGNPYKISSKENWNYMVHQIANQVSFAGKYLELTQDITIDNMAGSYVEGGATRPFAGTFDGKGHTLTIDLDGVGNYLAPFACLGGATVKNLVLAGSVSTTNIRPAGLAAFVIENSTIENCKNSVSISSSFDEEKNVGGGGYVARVNQGKSLTITGCSFSGNFTYSASTFIFALPSKGYGGGGFVGYAQSGSTVSLKDCVFQHMLSDGFLTIKGGGEDYDKKFYVFVGGKSDAVVTLDNSYYYLDQMTIKLSLNDGDLTPQGTQTYSVAGRDGVTVAMEGTETAYNVSGITVYSENPGIKYGSQLWGADKKVVKLLLSKGEPVASYTANHGTLSGIEKTGTNDHYMLTVDLGVLDWEEVSVYISYNGLLYLMDSDSSADIIEKENGKTHTVMLGRTFKGGEWNSFSVPFAISETMVKSVFGNTVSVRELTASSYTNGALRLDFSTVTSIEAGKAYLIKPVLYVTNPRFEGVVIDKRTTTTKTTVADFVPVINPTGFTVRDKSVLFFTGDGKLSFPSDEGPLKGFRGYLKLKGAAAGQQ
ncbi:MAG: hypothetical protein IKN00_06315 [Bacteroidales bacterium]|nr:hypothetical protein [Bacteroidales bacterium]